MQFNKSRGFNLIELMIVVAIIGIIAGIAYPSYTSSARKAKLEDARKALAQLSTALTREYNTKIPKTYGRNARNNANTGRPDTAFFPDTAPLDGADANYELWIDDADEAGFTVRAEGIAGVDLDPNCLSITLSSNGSRTPADCW